MVNSATGILGQPVDDIRNGGPIFGTGFRQVPPPTIFKAGFSSDKKLVVFTIGDPSVTSLRSNRAFYRLYFLPIGLGPPGRIAIGVVARNLFYQSTLVNSDSAPQNGGTIQLSDPTFSGLDGWYYGTAVNQLGVESVPAGPVRTPIVGANDARIPPSVTTPAVILEDGGLDPAGRQIVKAVCSANVPYQSNGIATIVVTNGGSGYTGDFQVTFTGGGGSGAIGFAHVSGGAVDFVDVTAPGINYTSNPTADFSQGDGAGAAGYATLTATGSFAGWQIYLGNYFQAGILVEGPVFGNKTNPTPGSKITSDFLLLADSPPVHDVKFYFVSVSQTGTRTDNPGAEPNVDFPTGVHL